MRVWWWAIALAIVAGAAFSFVFTAQIDDEVAHEPYSVLRGW